MNIYLIYTFDKKQVISKNFSKPVLKLILEQTSGHSC